LLQIVIILKALTEVAGFALIGQGILFILAGRNRDRNSAYVILRTVTAPVFALARSITPKFFLSEYVWLLTPVMVFLLWMLFTYLKIRLVLHGG
jgi:hypothetical protein